MTENDHGLDSDLEPEYQHILSDLKRVIMGNLVFLVLLIALFFIDRQFSILASLKNWF